LLSGLLLLDIHFCSNIQFSITEKKAQKLTSRSLSEALAIECKQQQLCFQSEDAKECLADYNEKSREDSLVD
jgi:hypothetical protein